MRTDIDAVFTDFGGVLLHLDFERCFDTFLLLGAETQKEILFKSPEFVRLMRNLETGQIDDDDFFNGLRDLLHIRADNTQMRSAWNTIIGTVPEYKLKVIREIRRHHRLYMVSNTNAPHFDYTRQTLFRGEGLTVDDYFDKLYLSHEIHAVKPEEEFYLKILNDSGENPSRSIFLDDLPANIQGAEKAGFKAYLIDPEEDLRKKITEILA